MLFFLRHECTPIPLHAGAITFARNRPGQIHLSGSQNVDTRDQAERKCARSTLHLVGTRYAQ
jgi:hypothetical protein